MKKLKILGVISIFLLYGILVGAGNAVAAGNARFTGAGVIGTTVPRAFHAFRLPCNMNQSMPQKGVLVVYHGGNRFTLNMLTQVHCFDDPGIDPGRPHANFDTIHGWGVGKWNGISGYYVEFIFTDGGEPGNGDWGWIQIYESETRNIVLEVSGFLKAGNHNARGNI